MTRLSFPLSRERVLVVSPRSDIRDTLVEHAGRPVAALVTSHCDADLSALDTAIAALLDGGCEYYVCFGAASEVLHDYIDELLVVGAVEREVTTTWHDDETAAEVVEFFVDVAAVKERSLLLVLAESFDDDVARSARIRIRQQKLNKRSTKGTKGDTRRSAQQKERRSTKGDTRRSAPRTKGDTREI